MRHRSELLQVYSNFAKMVETQFSKRIKIFRSDTMLEILKDCIVFHIEKIYISALYRGISVLYK